MKERCPGASCAIRYVVCAEPGLWAGADSSGAQCEGRRAKDGRQKERQDGGYYLVVHGAEQAGQAHA